MARPRPQRPVSWQRSDADRFATLLSSFDESLRDGDLDTAQVLLTSASAIVDRHVDPDARRRARDLVAANQQRLDTARGRPDTAPRPAPSIRDLPPTPVKKGKGQRTVRCVDCGKPFRPPKDEPKRRACLVCRPPRSVSVRTVSGGLPGLGRRR